MTNAREGSGGLPSLRPRLESLGGLLGWSVVDKSLLVIAVIFPWTLGGYLLLALGSERLFLGGVIDLEFSREVMQPFYVLTSAALAGLACWGLSVRRRAPDLTLLAHGVCQVTGIHGALVVYFTGTLTSSLWIAIIGGLAVGLVLFENNVMLGAALSIAFLLTATSIGQILGLLPYAPWIAVAPYGGGELRMPPAGALLLFSAIMALVAMLVMIFSFIITRWRERERQVTDLSAVLKKMFGRYLSPQVMDSLLQNPAALELGGHRRRVTVMMTDLRGFTQLAERMEPERFVQMLNAYYEVMMDVIGRYQGTVNEIIGDALLVIFGAPQGMPDRAARACACAVEMQNAMERVNEENRRNGFPELEMGIGLNDSEVIVGNIGSEKRSKYTVIGSGVNLASRIESNTVGGEVLASQSVVDEAKGLLRVDGRREALFKGAQSSTALYEVGGVAGEFGVALSRAADAPRSPPKPLRLRVATLEGKQVESEGREIEVTALSRKSARFPAGTALAPHTHVKLNLKGTSPALERVDFYGKVIADAEGGLVAIRFTALPAEVAAYIEGVLGS